MKDVLLFLAAAASLALVSCGESADKNETADGDATAMMGARHSAR